MEREFISDSYMKIMFLMHLLVRIVDWEKNIEYILICLVLKQVWREGEEHNSIAILLWDFIRTGKNWMVLF